MAVFKTLFYGMLNGVGAISKAEARRRLRLERVEFLELLRQHHMPIANYPPEDLDAEIDAVKSLLSKKPC